MFNKSILLNKYLPSSIASWYVKLAIFSILSFSIPSCNVEDNDTKPKTTITLEEERSNKRDNFDIYKINEEADILFWDEKYDLALENFIIILKIYDTEKDTLWLISTYSKIGNIHYEQDLYEKALTSFNQSLKLSTKLDNKLRQIKNYNNIAKSFYYEENIPLSSTAYDEALKIFDDWETNVNNKDVLKELVKTYEWLARISHKNGNKQKLQEYMNLAFDYSKETGDDEIKIAMILNISEVKYTIWDTNWALNYLLSNKKEIELLNIWHYNERLYRNISYFYKKIWNFEEALIYINKETDIKDKRKNSQSERIQADMEAKYESEKKDQEIKLKNTELKVKENETQIAEWKAKKNQIMLWWASALLVVLSGGWIFWYRKHKQTVKAKKEAEISKDESEEQKWIAEQKTEELNTINEELINKNEQLEEAKEEAEEQKMIAEQKTEEVNAVNEELIRKWDIIDNQKKQLEYAIEAARQQQKDRLPSQLTINKIFIENMILYKPKDNVSWDFYFVEQLWDIKIFATLDSTWHWVEWAMTSVAWLTSLRNSTKQWIVDPKELINRLNSSIYDSTWKEEKDAPAKYTMEWSILSYNEMTGALDFSWSKWEMFVFPQNDDHNIKEWKNENWFIIKKFKTDEWNYFYSFWTQKEFLWDTEKSKFKNYSINIDNAKIIMFSDGYQDQFWWKKWWKLKKRNFRDLVSDAVTDGVDLWDTKTILEEYLKDRMWSNDQIDDITVTGIEIAKKK